MRTLFAACLIALALPAAAETPARPTAQAASPSGVVEIRFSGARRGGPVLVQLSTEQEFMRASRFQTSAEVQPDGTARVRFTNVPPGRYAVTAFQDVNRDGQINFGPPWGGPVEPWGYSRGARGVMGPPNFSAAAVTIGPRGAVIDIALEL